MAHWYTIRNNCKLILAFCNMLEPSFLTCLERKLNACFLVCEKLNRWKAFNTRRKKNRQKQNFSNYAAVSVDASLHLESFFFFLILFSFHDFDSFTFFGGSHKTVGHMWFWMQLAIIKNTSIRNVWKAIFDRSTRSVALWPTTFLIVCTLMIFPKHKRVFDECYKFHVMKGKITLRILCDCRLLSVTMCAQPKLFNPMNQNFSHLRLSLSFSLSWRGSTTNTQQIGLN